MKRRLARELALQSLYQMQMNEVTSREAIQMAIEEAVHENEAGLEVTNEEISTEYIRELVDGTYNRLEEIDRLLEKYIKGWKMDRLSKVDREILRLATYEMIYRDDVPAKVVVNEAIELAKHFGSEESGKFVNGVLGQMIREVDQIKVNLQ
ncbi:transcription antitermination protein NusB [Chlamydia abortus]|jgi:N utilization substance protein B|uniref:Transcription antitermination protein NusB n=1 Tax=Paenibacillus residui TaxID=629724 RepID=A0ABW3DF59_9BACL|nr:MULTISPECIES: transcription antitermination factor NusB [Paenibacillaceae]SHE11145.1 transcription antitermination protein NusB [Chlamydia abortus]